jgi:DNA replication protein DnaC
MTTPIFAAQGITNDREHHKTKKQKGRNSHMLNEQTLATLNTLKLFGMAKSFSDKIHHPQSSELSHADFVGLLTQDEKTYRENLRLRKLLKKAKLRHPAAMEDVNYRHPRSLNKQVLLQLADTQWITHARNILITGPTGIGKSWIACALGNLAARSGYTVQYLRAPRLFEILRQSQGDGTHLKALNRLAKIQVLILDDFLLATPTDAERKDLLEIIEDRYAAASVILTSQLPTKEWHAAIDEPTLADAICDRLFHNAYKIELKGNSLRDDNDPKAGPTE